MGRWWDSAGLWTRFTRYDNWESCLHHEETDLGGVLRSRLGVALSSSCGGMAHGPPTPPNTCPEGDCQGFLRFFTMPSQDFGSAMSHGDSAPGDRRTHRTGCAPASTDRGCGSI